MRAFQRTQRLRALPARSWGFVCLALLGFLVPPTVTPCPVRAGLTSSRAASCCAEKETKPAEAARPAPVRACCARKAAEKAAQAEAPAEDCKMRGSCCCKARPTSGQVPVVTVSRISPACELGALSTTVAIEPDHHSDARLSFRPANPGGAVHLNQLLCRWHI